MVWGMTSFMRARLGAGLFGVCGGWVCQVCGRVLGARKVLFVTALWVWWLQLCFGLSVLDLQANVT
jgi:hypothetical protein